MSDPNQKKYRKLYAREFEAAKAFLVGNYGGDMKWVPHDYQAFQYILPDVCLVFYPHRTSARSYHIRVRDGNSKNKARAEALMAVIQVDGKKFQTICTFHQKNKHHGIWLLCKPQEADRLRRIANGEST